MKKTLFELILAWGIVTKNQKEKLNFSRLPFTLSIAGKYA